MPLSYPGFWEGSKAFNRNNTNMCCRRMVSYHRGTFHSTKYWRTEYHSMFGSCMFPLKANYEPQKSLKPLPWRKPALLFQKPPKPTHTFGLMIQDSIDRCGPMSDRLGARSSISHGWHLQDGIKLRNVSTLSSLFHLSWLTCRCFWVGFGKHTCGIWDTISCRYVLLPTRMGYPFGNVSFSIFQYGKSPERKKTEHHKAYLSDKSCLQAKARNNGFF